ncbi:MAG: hypothetical protein ACJ70P_00160, partial [Nitrososphaera sp.]
HEIGQEGLLMINTQKTTVVTQSCPNNKLTLKPHEEGHFFKLFEPLSKATEQRPRFTSDQMYIHQILITVQHSLTIYVPH